MTTEPADLLLVWLDRQLSDPSSQWLKDQIEKLKTDPSDRTLHLALGLAPRKLGKADLTLQPEDLEAAEEARTGWDPRGWSVDQAARVLFLLSVEGRESQFSEIFTSLCQTADVAEAISLYSGLPLYPQGETLEDQAAEGLRTNMRAIFEAVAHNSPYPREQFDENRWNHMVLKALFIDSQLAPIQGLDERANPELARIMRDYAHERWAAGRTVTPELWRCVGPFADTPEAVADLTRVSESPLEIDQQAAALALSASKNEAAKAVLEEMDGELVEAVKTGKVNWNMVADRL